MNLILFVTYNPSHSYREQCIFVKIGRVRRLYALNGQDLLCLAPLVLFWKLKNIFFAFGVSFLSFSNSMSLSDTSKWNNWLHEWRLFNFSREHLKPSSAPPKYKQQLLTNCVKQFVLTSQTHTHGHTNTDTHTRTHGHTHTHTYTPNYA